MSASRLPALAIIMLAALSCAPGDRPLRDTPTTPAAPCGPGDSLAEHVAFARANLGPNVHGGVGYLRGPAVRTVVRDDGEWAALWRQIGDTIPKPRIVFGDSVLVVVASPEFTSGPWRVEIEDVRRCHGNGDLVVFTRLYGQTAGRDYGDRSVRSILVGRSHVGERQIRFAELPKAIRP